jgi:hypothetical protein
MFLFFVIWGYVFIVCFLRLSSWMEVVVTGHNFESILPKDHPCHVCFKLADWFQKRRLLNNFPIGSLKLCLLMVAILNRDHVRWASLCFYFLLFEVMFLLFVFWGYVFIFCYLRLCFYCLFSHLGWRSWSPDIILKVYYPRTIHAMFALNWLTGFRREDF